MLTLADETRKPVSCGEYRDAALETMPRKNLEALQLRLLQEHLALAAEHSPWNRASFRASQVEPARLRSLHDLRDYPFITKGILRERQISAPLLGDLLAVPEVEVVYASASSGSTGVPTLSPFTAGDFEAWQEVQARLFHAAGMRANDRYLHALNFSMFVGGPDVIGAQKLGALCFWAGTVPAERLLFLMQEFQPTVTWTTPSYAWYLGESAKAQGVDPSRELAINRIIVAGEPGGSLPATRAAIESLWGAELYDFYGISDIFGASAGMCRERNGLHFCEDHHIVEVLDPATGWAVPDGEKGEMVLTTLQKRARPMIRFRTGDIVTRDSSPCPCGRTHARIWVHGRCDDMFIVNGVNLFPADIEVAVRSLEEATGEYRITLTREHQLTRFYLEIERRPDSLVTDEALAQRLKSLLKSRYGIAPGAIKVHAQNTLPRAVHKAQRIIDKR